MAKSVNDLVIDAALDVIATSGSQAVCQGQPTTRTEALVTNALATNALTTGDGAGDYTISNGDTSGRKINVAQQASVTVTATGSANHIAYCDATNLLFVTTCTSQVLSAIGNTVTIGTHDIEISDPA